jgi:hypothetical protein
MLQIMGKATVGLFQPELQLIQSIRQSKGQDGHFKEGPELQPLLGEEIRLYESQG